jgi:hypothetical protein
MTNRNLIIDAITGDIIGSVDNIKNFITEKFENNLNRKIDDIKPIYEFDVSCQCSIL